MKRLWAWLMHIVRATPEESELERYGRRVMDALRRAGL